RLRRTIHDVLRSSEYRAPLRWAPHSTSTFFFPCSGQHPALHSFPTRTLFRSQGAPQTALETGLGHLGRGRRLLKDTGIAYEVLRSEEHTSELQSLAYLVCRLLLDKKNGSEHFDVALAVADHMGKLGKEGLGNA